MGRPEDADDERGAIRMDSLITAAARALAAGDALGALKRVALRNDASALALRGIAMARLGDLVRASALLRDAARDFGIGEAVSRARCIVALAEIDLVSRHLEASTYALDAARATLTAHGDRLNAAYAHCLQIRRLLLIGQLDEAERQLADLDPAPLPPPARALQELAIASLALRRLHTGPARAALTRAAQAARQAAIPALQAEVDRACAMLAAPAARVGAPGNDRLLRLDEVESVLASDALVIDACRHRVCAAGHVVPLASRPVLFALVRALAESWPDDAPRGVLFLRAFRTRHADESHRARLRVEMGRLRRLLQPFADIAATPRGFTLVPQGGRAVVVLAPPLDGPHADVLALLADGEAWSSSALALALGVSQRSVQRALDNLLSRGALQSFGRARTRRWVAPPMPGIATVLLLPPPPGAP